MKKTKKTKQNMLVAAENMDWMQVALNGGPPCFHYEDGSFCGRAKAWDGHVDGDPHRFISLADLLKDIYERR